MRVRPLAAPPRPVLKANYSKAELIAAMGVTTTLAVQEIAETALPDGDLVATPPVFECKVTGGLVRVTYVREGFVTEGLPTLGACGEGPGAVPFRIEVAPVPEET